MSQCEAAESSSQVNPQVIDGKKPSPWDEVQRLHRSASAQSRRGRPDYVQDVGTSQLEIPQLPGIELLKANSSNR